MKDQQLLDTSFGQKNKGLNSQLCGRKRFLSARSIGQTPVWRYLCARGLGDLVPSRELRFVKRLACWEVPDGQNIDGAAKARLVGEFPAMLARLTNAEGKFITLHRTYLTADGSKAPVHSAKKLAAGAVENGVIRLYPAGGVVCLAEGIETALSVHALTGLPAWSVVSLSGMKRFGPETHPGWRTYDSDMRRQRPILRWCGWCV